MLLRFLLGHFGFSTIVKYRILAIVATPAHSRVLGQICHLLFNILGVNLSFADFVLYI